MKLETVLAEYRQEILRLARQHGMEQVSIFGSVARGESTPSSDLDLLVEVEPGRSLFDLIAFKLDVEALIGCSVDVVSRQGVSPHLAEYIFAHEVPL